MSQSRIKDLQEWQFSGDSTMDADDLLNSSLCSQSQTPLMVRVNRILTRAESAKKAKITRQLSMGTGEESSSGVDAIMSAKPALPEDVTMPAKCALPEVKERVIRSFAPGLSVFSVQSGLTFYHCGQLHLVNTFGYTGRTRLLKWCPTSLVEEIVSDPLVTARYLFPSLGTSCIIRDQRDFEQVVDFMFYSAVACYENIQHREVLEKCVIDLLTTYGYEWQLTNSHLVTWLANYGGDPKLLCHRGDEGAHGGGAVPQLTRLRSSARPPAPLGFLLSRGLRFIKDILRLDPDRHAYARDPKHCVSAIRILFILGQERTVIRDGIVRGLVSSLVQFFLSLIPGPTTDLVAEVSQVLTVELRPVHLVPATLNWDYYTLPPHFRMLGLNHPHNSLCSLSLLPRTPVGTRLRGLMSVVLVQLLLGVGARLVVPDRPGMRLTSSLLQQVKSAQWNRLHQSLYSMNILVSLVDQLYLSCTGRTWRSADSAALTSVYQLFQALKATLPAEDSLNLDPAIVRRNMEDILTRWRAHLGEDAAGGSLQRAASPSPPVGSGAWHSREKIAGCFGRLEASQLTADSIGSLEASQLTADSIGSLEASQLTADSIGSLEASQLTADSIGSLEASQLRAESMGPSEPMKERTAPFLSEQLVVDDTRLALTPAQS